MDWEIEESYRQRKKVIGVRISRERNDLIPKALKEHNALAINWNLDEIKAQLDPRLSPGDPSPDGRNRVGRISDQFWSEKPGLHDISQAGCFIAGKAGSQRRTANDCTQHKVTHRWLLHVGQELPCIWKISRDEIQGRAQASAHTN